jgi:VWA domain-containing protein
VDGMRRSRLHRLGLSLGVLAATAVVAPAAGDDEVAPRVAAFAKVFFPNEKAKPPYRPSALDRRAALENLKGLDAAPVARALVEAAGQCETERAALEEQQNKAKDEIAAITADNMTGRRQMPGPLFQRFQSLKSSVIALSGEIDAMAALERDVIAPLLELKSDDSVAWLCRNAMSAKQVPYKLKVAVAQRAAVRDASMVALLSASLAKAKENEEIAILIAGLAAAGPAAKPAAAAVAARLAEKEPAIREQAAAALAVIAAPEGVAPLIHALEVESDAHTKQKIAIALEILTHKEFGLTAGAWKDWWKREGEAAVAGGAQLGGGSSKLARSLTEPIVKLAGARPKDPNARSYYGIPVDGRSIVYVIDCSGSMVASITDPHYDEKRVPENGGRDSRMEASKTALIDVLGRLGPKDQFDVIAFSDQIHPYAPGLRAASPTEVVCAQDFVKKLEPANCTNIKGAMQEAFRLAGRGAFDKWYASGVDTIFLLTDGAPTTPDNKLDSTDAVLESVRQWNPNRRVVIHTIGIGKDVNDVFLKQLASENGGRFVWQ